MKIAILTFWWSKDNYGQQLQAYALQRYLRDLGHDAFLIKYDSRKDLIQNPMWKKLVKACNPKKLLRFINYKYIQPSIQKKEEKDFPRYFEVFRNNYISFTKEEYLSYNHLKECPPEADVYIVGSDQVWNFSGGSVYQSHNFIHSYFLDFGKPEIKRISYAASWGKKTVTKEFVKEIAPLLKKFNSVGVREKSGVELARICDFSGAVWTKDPTLLLSAAHYRKLYESDESVKNIKDSLKKPYLVFYYLNNGGKFKKKSVFEFAKKNGLEVKYISANSNYDEYSKIYPTIPQWLYLIDNAKYVITNSFHCCVFSIIFEKRFGAIKMTGENVEMNERFVSLFEITGIKSRYLTDLDMTVLDMDVEKPKVPKDTFIQEILYGYNKI